MLHYSPRIKLVTLTGDFTSCSCDSTVSCEKGIQTFKTITCYLFFICLPESIKLTSDFTHCSCDSTVAYERDFKSANFVNNCFISTSQSNIWIQLGSAHTSLTLIMTWAIVFRASATLAHIHTLPNTNSSLRPLSLVFATSGPVCPGCDVAINWRERKIYFKSIDAKGKHLLVAGMAAKYWSPPPYLP